MKYKISDIDEHVLLMLFSEEWDKIHIGVKKLLQMPVNIQHLFYREVKKAMAIIDSMDDSLISPNEVKISSKLFVLKNLPSPNPIEMSSKLSVLKSNTFIQKQLPLILKSLSSFVSSIDITKKQDLRLFKLQIASYFNVLQITIRSCNLKCNNTFFQAKVSSKIGVVKIPLYPMLQSLDIKTCTIDALPASLSKYEHLRSLDLGKVGKSDLTVMPSVKYLSFNVDAMVHNLWMIPMLSNIFPNLETLRIRNGLLLSDPALLYNALAKMPNFRILHLDWECLHTRMSTNNTKIRIRKFECVKKVFRSDLNVFLDNRYKIDYNVYLRNGISIHNKDIVHDGYQYFIMDWHLGFYNQ